MKLGAQYVEKSVLNIEHLLSDVFGLNEDKPCIL